MIKKLVAVVLLTGVATVMAQVPFPQAGLVNATSQQAALAVIGANQAEMSGYLLLDAPDIALPGKLKILGKSLLPGTSQLLLLRVTLASAASQSLREKPFVAGQRIAPGKPATLETEIDADSTLNLLLLAQSRGKWFYASREVKIGRPTTGP